MPEYLTRKDRMRIESFSRLGEDIILGRVEIDQETCSGCGLCVPACAGNAIVMVDKKARMNETLPLCMGCGDCVAICPDESITIAGYLELKRAFRYLDRGHPEPPRRF